MRLSITGLLIGLACLLFVTQAKPQTQAVTLNVAVAANFAQPLAIIADSYFAKTGHRIHITVGSSGALFAQIVHGAPFDVFLSADAKRPEALVEQGLAEFNDVVTYARGQLALIGAGSSGLNALPEASDSTRIAIADPRLAPYGLAAQEFLTGMGLWEHMGSRLIRGSNIQQTLQFWQTGNVQLALIAASQCVSYQLSCVMIEAEKYTDIIQKLSVVGRSHNKDIARDFVSYLLSHEVQYQLSKMGYLPVSPIGESR